MSNDIKEMIRGYYDVYFNIGAIYEEFAKMHGLTSSSLFVLYIVHQQPEQCTQATIVEQLFYPKQTVSSILNSFDKLGYITKNISVQDRRIRHISLTEAGQQFAGQVIADMLELEETAFIRMKDAERKGMLQGEQAFLKQLTWSMETLQAAKHASD
ncbi:MarR family transcriptional regulator [Paenibacillus sp. MMS20-IR301]|uniref:MarR family winged helix-turn-helix transcriptional regulator n=1 Tax=Paenibacillus sp. MMS20-IR301 TaxID=2895946 RepID=UPI0028E8261C|nr:MarR family transcriptional regulator [Paenibacillus sp. MMS20-IR301]WNS45213.1 MarR family transcriptional regulator [Paenibacillus sp. MMS20-IR301]